MPVTIRGANIMLEEPVIFRCKNAAGQTSGMTLYGKSETQPGKIRAKVGGVDGFYDCATLSKSFKDLGCNDKRAFIEGTSNSCSTYTTLNSAKPKRR